MQDLQESLHVIFVRTQFASNLGTSVRVLGNMGFRRLVLITPECEIGVEARARAMKGAETLDRARFFPSLEAAQKEIPILVAITARGSSRRGAVSPRRFVEQSLNSLRKSPFGLVFGPEDNGLRKQEMKLCHYRLKIPTVGGNASLNLSQAVAVVAYEMHLAGHRDHGSLGIDGRNAAEAVDSEKIQSLLSVVDRLLAGMELPPGHSRRRLMTRMRSLASRSQWEEEDLNMLLGLLSSFNPPRQTD